MKKIIKTINHTIAQNIFIGERYERNLQLIGIEAIIVFVIGVLMSVVNLFYRDYLGLITPLVFAVVSPICYFLVRVKKMRVLTIIITMMTILTVFTYAVFFVPNGFTYLWIMLVPLSVGYLFGIKEGILSTIYFEIVFIIAFYTPIKEWLGDNYQSIITNRFPILYFFHGLITIFVIYQYHKSVLTEIESENKLQNEVIRQTKVAVDRAISLERLSNDVVIALARTIDAKDKYTNGHSSRVSEYAVKLAEKLGFDDNELKNLEREALLHDIGKIGVPDSILNKPTKLNDYEYMAIREHTIIGKKIVDGLEDMKYVGDVAMYHHERYDGTGYPRGLKGEEIPLHARIVALADAYDAMNSERVYRKALSREKIIQEIEEGRGTQFDPNLANDLLELIHDNVI